MRAALAIVSLLLVSSCIGTSPEEQLRADQGDYDDGDEEHRPGQPCLACHRSDFSPGGDVFVIAGTIFASKSDDDEDGFEGAEIIITDADLRSFTALSNEAGNFMIEVDSGVSEPTQRKEGRLKIPFSPTFPLRVEVRTGDTTQEMEGQIGRDGSCASCHRGETASADGVEKVWLFED